MDFCSALDFFHRIYRSKDIDEDKFMAEFNQFKATSQNKSEHQIEEVKGQIKMGKFITSPPTALGIHINRLCYDNYGVHFIDSRHIKFPVVYFLDVKKEDDNGKPYYSRVKYELYGVIEHMGNPRFGHYIAFKRLLKAQGKDTEVKEINQEEEKVRPKDYEKQGVTGTKEVSTLEESKE